MTRLTGIGPAAALAAASQVGAAASAQDAPQLTHIDEAASMEIQSMEMPGINAYLEDVVSSDDPDQPITCGFFRLEASSEPLVYDYTYGETKIILDGVITVSDGTNTVDATEGDVLLLPKGANITFTTDSEGTAFVCGARERDGA